MHCGALQQLRLQFVAAIFPVNLIFAKGPEAISFLIGLLKKLVQLLGAHFRLISFSIGLNRLTEVNLQPARQLQAEFPLQHIGDTAFARLTVDADHFLVRTANIRRVYRQVGNLPGLAGFPQRQALLDGVLVAAGERGKHQLARIGMPRVHRQLRTFFDRLDNLIHLAEIQSGIHTLTVEIHRHSHDIHIASALAIAHQRAFYPVCPGHNAKLSSGHAAPTIVMRVQGDQQTLSIRHPVAEPLNLVGIDIRGAHFDCRRQVDNHRMFRSGLPYGCHRVANLHGKIQLSPGEALRGILKYPLGLRLARGAIPHQLSTFYRDIQDALSIEAEYLFALHR